jgi:hypothetical protein
MLDYDCGIDAVVKLPMKGTYSIRFISLKVFRVTITVILQYYPTSKSTKRTIQIIISIQSSTILSRADSRGM